VVRVDVAGCDRLDAQVLGEVAKQGVAMHVAALEGPLQLDEEAIQPECVGQPGGGVGIADAETEPRATGEADEPLRELGDELGRNRRRTRLPVFAARASRACMRGGQKPAEVRVAPP
jgi:hypothetical protein